MPLFIFAGAIILASSVAGTRFRRVREMAIFKTLGATRGRIAKMFSAEFLILGLAAGAIGSLLATGFTRMVLKRFFEEYKALEHKQVIVEDLLGPADAIRIITEALELYRKLRRGEL